MLKYAGTFLLLLLSPVAAMAQSIGGVGVQVYVAANSEGWSSTEEWSQPEGLPPSEGAPHPLRVHRRRGRGRAALAGHHQVHRSVGCR